MTGKLYKYHCKILLEEFKQACQRGYLLASNNSSGVDSHSVPGKKKLSSISVSSEKSLRYLLPRIASFSSGHLISLENDLSNNSA